MYKRLTNIGNSLGIIIDKPILELLDIDRNTDIEIRTDGDTLILRPVRIGRKKMIEEASGELIRAHGKTYEKLAE